MRQPFSVSFREDQQWLGANPLPAARAEATAAVRATWSGAPGAEDLGSGTTRPVQSTGQSHALYHPRSFPPPPPVISPGGRTAPGRAAAAAARSRGRACPERPRVRAAGAVRRPLAAAVGRSVGRSVGRRR